jgi:hypothetical protein
MEAGSRPSSGSKQSSCQTNETKKANFKVQAARNVKSAI